MICFILLTAIFSSCKKDFLEIVPKGMLIAKSTTDYDRLLNNLDLLNSNNDAQAALGDEIVAVEPYFSAAWVRTQRLFRRDDVIYEPNEDAAELKAPMTNIYLYNKLINEVMGSSDGTLGQKRSLQAEAMVGRAWTYFLLINYYGKPYNTTTSSTDPGFPIITAADVTATKFTRAPVKEVYDFIVNDLTAAIPDLPSQLTHRLRVSRATAEAILGKVYMFMGKYNEAVSLLNNAITGFGSATIPVRLYDYNITLAPGGSFLPVSIFGPTFPFATDIEENVFAKQFANLWTFVSNEFVISPQTVSLFNASDLRLKFYSKLPFSGSTAYPAGMLRRIGPIATQFGMVVPDVYLLRAEARARTNDLAGAKADVEALRVKRMPAADAAVPAGIAANQAALVRFILEERIREFAVQGYRWFDMRRLSVDPAFSSTVGNTHQVYSSSGTVSATYTLKQERLLLRFPQKLMDQNPGMQNNE